MPFVVLDHAHWAQLEQVQLQVDGQVIYKTDQQQYGVNDLWEPARKYGDCEDFALAKREKLIALGWPADDLRIALVKDERGELHAVLTVDVTSQKGAPATYVLDNRFLHVEPWKRLSEFGYTWLARSRPGASQWTLLADATPTASTRMVRMSVTAHVGQASGGPGAEASPARMEGE